MIIGKMYSIEHSVSYTLKPTILGAFAKLRKATISFILCVRLSACMGQTGSYWTIFMNIFRKSIEKIQV
jgi:hypothetical protein